MRPDGSSAPSDSAVDTSTNDTGTIVREAAVDADRDAGFDQACHASGSSCTADAECCNKFCDRPGGAARGSCALVAACLTNGEPCGEPGSSGGCCSTLCRTNAGESVARCQYAGGCRVQEELCTSDRDCCSNACRQAGATLDGRSIMRCATTQACLQVGELCGMGANCCPPGGGATGCERTASGVFRCLGGTPGCTLPGRACQTNDECCLESFPALLCQTSSAANGEKMCCLSDGEICALDDLCCGGNCAPSTLTGDAPGTLRCGSVRAGN